MGPGVLPDESRPFECHRRSAANGPRRTIEHRQEPITGSRTTYCRSRGYRSFDSSPGKMTPFQTLSPDATSVSKMMAERPS